MEVALAEDRLMSQIDSQISSPGSIPHGFAEGYLPSEDLYYEGHFWNGKRIGNWNFRDSNGQLVRHTFYRPEKFQIRLFLSRLFGNFFYAPEVWGRPIEKVITYPIYGIGLIFRGTATLMVQVMGAWLQTFMRSPLIGILMLILMVGSGQYLVKKVDTYLKPNSNKVLARKRSHGHKKQYPMPETTDENNESLAENI